MSLETGGWLLATLLGGLLALDGTSVGQFMLSRPLVACTLAGALAGSPARGALIGVVLEALHLAVLPVGASRYPEAAPAAVAAATVFAASPGDGGTLLMLTLFALGWEQVGSWSMSRLRAWNGSLLDRPLATAAQVERLHLRCVGSDALRALLVTAVGLGLAAACAALAGALRPIPGLAGGAVMLAAGAAVASSLRLFGLRRLPWFVAGAAVAAAVEWAA